MRLDDKIHLSQDYWELEKLYKENKKEIEESPYLKSLYRHTHEEILFDLSLKSLSKIQDNEEFNKIKIYIGSRFTIDFFQEFFFKCTIEDVKEQLKYHI